MKFFKILFRSRKKQTNILFDKGFWEIVLEDYKNGESCFICLSSSYFKSKWESFYNREKIRDLATSFLKQSGKYDFKEYRTSKRAAVLFCEHEKQVRIDFLNWVIGQFN